MKIVLTFLLALTWLLAYLKTNFSIAFGNVAKTSNVILSYGVVFNFE
jgi:hypothetical protein